MGQGRFSSPVVIFPLSTLVLSACTSSAATPGTTSTSAPSAPARVAVTVSAQPTATPTPLLSMPTVVQPPTATATAVPPTVVPTPTMPKVSVEITLFAQVPDWAKGKIGLSVVNGEYRVKSGATLLTGSQVYVYESDLPLSSCLGISVGKGGVTLQGTQYPEGTKLIADGSGRLIKIS